MKKFIYLLFVSAALLSCDEKEDVDANIKTIFYENCGSQWSQVSSPDEWIANRGELIFFYKDGFGQISTIYYNGYYYTEKPINFMWSLNGDDLRLILLPLKTDGKRQDIIDYKIISIKDGNKNADNYKERIGRLTLLQYSSAGHNYCEKYYINNRHLFPQ